MSSPSLCEQAPAPPVEDRRYALLLVDDDPIVLAAMGRILQDIGDVRVALNGPDALRLALDSPPDLVLLDVQMPGMSGFDLCVEMKRAAELADIPIIFITSHDGADQEVEALGMGAADFISKPPIPALVVARVRAQLRMKRMADQLRHHALVDALTGVANRRRLDEDLQTEWLRARRNREPISLLLIDVDYFKRFNDAYGHQAGDRCLRLIAQAMRSALHRPSDLLARYGGEEFAVVLPGTDSAGARVVAGHLLDAVSAAAIEHRESPVSPTVSISVGIGACAFRDEGAGHRSADLSVGPAAPNRLASDLVAAADAALYAAKEGGRRRARLMEIGDDLDPRCETPVARTHEEAGVAFADTGV